MATDPRQALHARGAALAMVPRARGEIDLAVRAAAAATPGVGTRGKAPIASWIEEYEK
jgi:hypothetical protein